MSALDDVVRHFELSADGEEDAVFAAQAAAELRELRERIKVQDVELATLRVRNKELEEYHGFYNGTIPEGEPTVAEEKLRAALEEARKIIEITTPYVIGRLPEDRKNYERARTFLASHPTPPAQEDK